MSIKKTKPFNIQRSDSNTSFGSIGFGGSSTFEDPTANIGQPQQSFQRKNQPYLRQGSLPQAQSIFKTDQSLIPELLDKYQQANLHYREEEFTQQSELFVTKIAQDKKIPKEMKAKFPVYQILISVCKIFMLTEYEIVVFSCMLDHCTWKIDEVINVDEGGNLAEFPTNYGIEQSDECKRFTMYLLVVTFSLKQYLNDKAEADLIQAYLEKICNNFYQIFNRATRKGTLPKFSFQAPEINKKYKALSKRNASDNSTSIKDYNMIVDNIMTLTGSYGPKKPETTGRPLTPSHNPGRPEPEPPKQNPIFNDLPDKQQSSFFKQDTTISNAPEMKRGFSRNMSLMFGDDEIRIPSVSRQNSFTGLMTNIPSTGPKRQSTYELNDDTHGKKVKSTGQYNSQNTKQEESLDNPQLQSLPSLFKKESLQLPDFNQLGSVNLQNQQSINKGGDEDFHIAMPGLSKKNSTASQPELEAPSLSRFNSNLSFLYKEN